VFQTGKVTDETKHELLAVIPAKSGENGEEAEEILRDYTKFYKGMLLTIACR
jgi:hypothetical protein